MSEEKDIHMDRDTLDEARTNRFLKTRIDILDEAATRKPFDNNAITPSGVTVPTTDAHSENQQHLDTNEKNHLDFFNGTFLDKMTGALTQSGTDVRLTIGKEGGGDLRVRFSSGYITIADDSTIDLPQGSDTVPIKYFVYVLQSSGVLTSSTVNFPSAEHAKVATVLAPLAAFVDTNGAYHFQIHNDPAMDENNQGHYSHHSFRTRVQGAKYLSGVDAAGTSGYLTIAATNVEFKSSAGVISQMHPHAYGAKDTSTGTIMLMANDATTPYNDFTDLFSIVTLKDGTTAWGANKWIKLVFFGSANQSGTFSPIFCNKPSGQENTADLAREDNNNYADFDIPAEFLGTGFRICSVVVKKTDTWGFDSTQDLREGLGAGGGGGGHVKYTGAEAIAAVEAEATLELSGVMVITNSSGNNLTIDSDAAGQPVNEVVFRDQGGNVSSFGQSSAANDITHFINYVSAAIQFWTGGSVKLEVSTSGMQLGGANARVTTILDEDDLSSDSATSLITQQSIKAYSDQAIRVYPSITQLGNGALLGGTASHAFYDMPAADSDCFVRMSFTLPKNIGSTITFKMHYFLLVDSSDYQTKVSVSAIDVGEDRTTEANNVLNETLTADVPAATLDELALYTLNLSDANISATGSLGIIIQSAASNAARLVIFDMWLEFT